MSGTNEAREARYAEVITAVGRGLGWNDFYDEDAACAARAVMTVADAEQADYVAIIERLTSERDKAREDCGFQKGLKEHIREELSTFIRLKAEAEAALVSERDAHAALRARVEAVLADRDHSDTCSDALSPDAGYPCTCFRADLRAALADMTPAVQGEVRDDVAGQIEDLLTWMDETYPWFDRHPDEFCTMLPEGGPTMEHRVCAVVRQITNALMDPNWLDKLRGAEAQAAAPSGSDDTKGGAA